jgi:hypothetical protein
MVRPANPIALTKTLEDDSVDEVQISANFWIVLYKEQYINVRRTTWHRRGAVVKYRKVGFATRSGAERLAAQLNREWNCKDFTVGQVCDYKLLEDL